MEFERLWAPWRLSYIKGDEQPRAPQGKLAFLPGADPECFFCRGVADSADREHLIVHRGDHTFTLLNRYPYNNGHLLIAPRAHKARLENLEAGEQQELFTMIGRMTCLVERLMGAEGFNVGLNLGRVAGAGVPGHLHWHIVPRWSGDTNFMPTLAQTRVIPQSLDALWQLMVGAT